MGVKLTIVEGDCLQVLPEIPDESVDLVFADYPFNCQDGRKDYLQFVKETAEEFYRVLKVNCALIVINNPSNIFKTIKFYSRFVFRGSIALIRKGALRPAWHFGFQHNYCVIFLKPDESGKADVRMKWNGTKQNHDKTFMTDVVHYQNGFRKGKHWHPQAVPLGLTKKLVEIFSDKEDLVLDPFLGSGTTMKASLELDRNCFGIELKPKYAEMARSRVDGGQKDLIIEGRLTR